MIFVFIYSYLIQNNIINSLDFIKLNTVDSTNDFLKNYSKINTLNNFTVVASSEQTKGRGQRDKKWFSEPYKNLTFSILVPNLKQYELDGFGLNILISNCIFDFIHSFSVLKTAIKWPNDILIRNNKIAGVLIEIIHRNNTNIDAIVGVGINVNQLIFDQLQNATSLSIETKNKYNLDELLHQISNQIKLKITKYKKSDLHKELYKYNTYLYKKRIPSVFKNQQGKLVLAIIKEVTIDGKIHLIEENDVITSYGTGDLRMILPS